MLFINLSGTLCSLMHMSETHLADLLWMVAKSSVISHWSTKATFYLCVKDRII